MNYVLCVTMIDSLKECLHISRSSILRERLISLLRNLLEQLCASNVLHDEVDVLLIVVSLVILYDVRVIKRVQDCYLFHDAVNIVPQFDFVKNLDGNLKVFVMLV